MKKRTLWASILTIVLCVCLSSGSTLALFTANDSADVSVKGGKVAITALVNEKSLKIYSREVEQFDIDENGVHYFENDGTASFDEESNLVLDCITPGDKAVFVIDVVNKSNIDIMYRVKWSVEGELMDALVATADNEAIEGYASAWTNWDMANGNTFSIQLSVELPYDTENDYQNKTAIISYSVEAVQANADLPWEGDADTAWFDPDNVQSEYVLDKPSQVAGLADLVDAGNDFDGVTIKLDSDLDFEAYDANGNRVSFDPIGYGYDIVFKGTFDGQGHTISGVYQNGWELGLSYGTQGGGLFASVVDATIKNVNIDGFEVVMECVDMGSLVGYSYGECTYENITVSNSTVANYNRYTGGVVGEVNGKQTFINVDVDNTTKVSSLWGTPDAAVGGIVGGKYGDCELTFIDCDVACEIDAFNDVVANYQYYNYRLSGMLIGNTEEATDGVATASFLTATNCTVTYGDWVNYTYCEFESNGRPSYAGEGDWKYSRVQAGYATGGIGEHTHDTDESHEVLLVYDQIFGGGKGVKGGKTHTGVTVIYPESSGN